MARAALSTTFSLSGSGAREGHIAEHPLLEWLERGVDVVLGIDHPLELDLTLPSEAALLLVTFPQLGEAGSRA
jgi:hypothetical protein